MSRIGHRPCRAVSAESMHGFYVHEATLLMGSGADPAAPGAAVTVALCGSWQHPPPCPLAAHHTAVQHTAVQHDGGRLGLRIVFAADPGDEVEVRRRIEEGLAQGTLAGPDGRVSHWTLLAGKAGEPTPAEQAQAQRMAGT